MHVTQVPKNEWAHYSETTHLVVFGERKPAHWDRIDYALVAWAENPAGKRPAAYVTCRELDAKSVYWQFGGALPETKGTVGSLMACHAFLRWSKERYERVSFLIENTNTAMLKMAMKTGFRIVGIRNFKGSILLEHLLEFEKGN